MILTAVRHRRTPSRVLVAVAYLCASVSSPPQAAAAIVAPSPQCPSVAQAKVHAQEGSAKRDASDLLGAADEMEAAYRCMPEADGSLHDRRWIYIAAFLEIIKELQASNLDARPSPDARHEQLCRMQALLQDYLRSVAAIQPPSQSTLAAKKRLENVDQELMATPHHECVKVEVPEEENLMSKVRGGEAVEGLVQPKPEPVTTPQPHRPLQPLHPLHPHRALWISGGVVGGLAIAAGVVMGVELKNGAKIEGQTSAAKEVGDLQRIREDLYPRGSLANKLAISGAILGGALLVSAITILGVAGHRTRLTKRNVSLNVTPLGIGFYGRF